jgi:hypothetical protein
LFTYTCDIQNNENASTLNIGETSLLVNSDNHTFIDGSKLIIKFTNKPKVPFKLKVDNIEKLCRYSDIEYISTDNATHPYNKINAKSIVTFTWVLDCWVADLQSK